MEKNNIKSLANIFRIKQTALAEDYVVELIKNISKELDIKYVLVGSPKSTDRTTIQTEFTFVNGTRVDNIEYQLKDTPCENVVTGQRVCIHSQNVAVEFAKDLLLQEMGVEAYIGAPIILPNGELLGLLVLLDDKKFTEPDFLYASIELFASRIALEISRKKLDEKINNLEIDLENKTRENVEIVKKAHLAIMQQEKLAATGRVVAGVAHEIRNPLNLVLNYNLILKDLWSKVAQNNPNIPLAKDIDKCIGIISESSLRMKTILMTMLESGRETGLQQTEYDLEELIHRTYQYAYDASRAKERAINCRVITDISEKKWGFTSDIQSLFLNLFENSLCAIEKKYQEGLLNAEIKILIKKNNGKLMIKIRDNGIGIKKENIDYIFEPFFTTKPTGEGTGLGLSVAANIVKNNKGKIEVSSEPGEFTEFDLVFNGE